MSTPLDAVFEKLHETLARELLVRIETGEATAAELTAASKFLKDNGIDSSASQSQPLHDLAKSLPFIDPEQIIERTGSNG